MIFLKVALSCTVLFYPKLHASGESCQLTWTRQWGSGGAKEVEFNKSWEDTVSATSFRRKGIEKENSNALDNIVRILASFIKTFYTVEQCRTLVLSSPGKLRWKEITEPVYTPWLWCAYCHYQGNGKPRFHTCLSRHGHLQFQIQFWSHNLNSGFLGLQRCRSLLLSARFHPERWTLGYCNSSVVRLVDQ